MLHRLAVALILAGLVWPAPPVRAQSDQPFGFVGMQVQDLTEEIRASLGVEAGGVFILDIAVNGPSAAAGFRRGDVILEMGGSAVTGLAGLVQFLQTTRPGQEITALIRRAEGAETITMTLGEWPPGWLPNPGTASLPEFGLTVASLSAALKDRMRVRWGMAGVAVTKVDSDSLARKAGLAFRDVIVQVNQRPVHDARHFAEIMSAPETGSGPVYVLLVENEDGFRMVALPRPGETG